MTNQENFDLHEHAQFTELWECLETRFPDENVGISWRPTHDNDSIIVVCGSVESFKNAIPEVDPDFVGEPVKQYCRDLPDNNFVDEDVSGIIKVKAASPDDAMVTLISLVTTGGVGAIAPNN